MMNPKVSVVIPTYERAKFLKLTLESIADQTFKDFEVIVIDDGSRNDDARKVCDEFSFCRYLKIENSGGPAKPRNRGIDMAKGKYIAFVDDDDLWMPEKLAMQVTILDQNPEFGLVHSYCECINKDGKRIGAIVGKPGTPDVKHGDCFFKMIGNWTVMMPTPLIRTEIVKLSKGFNELITPSTEDVEFFTRLSLLTKFWFINQPLVWYRTHQGNISGNKENYKDKSFALKRIAEDAFLANRITEHELRAIYKRLYIHFVLKGSKDLSKELVTPRKMLLKSSNGFGDLVKYLFLDVKLKLKLELG
jgi:glycosyltransferase involved in cell wall biosynthesis